MTTTVRYCLLLFIAGGASFLPAQAPPEDSLTRSLELLGELVRADNFEEAQLEAGRLREFLQQQQVFCPAEAVPILSTIYYHNQDKKSALAFLEEALEDARRDRNPKTQARLLEVLVEAYNKWKQAEAASACQQLLLAAREAQAEHQHKAAIDLLHLQIDSLSRLQQREQTEQARYIRLDRASIFLLAGTGTGLLLALLLFNWRNTRRWRKRLARKEMENEFLRSDRFTSTLQTDTHPVPVPSVSPELAAPQEKLFQANTQRPDKTALFIEPNRQIVLYLKSLLSDRFEIETAGSASEGLQVANNLLPDLIVCDAVLNGQTGIEVVRKIKLSERTNHIPIILLTARSGNEGKLDALRAGADAWFSRPVLDNEFDAQVTQLLDARKELHENFTRFLHLYYSENRIEPDDPFLSQAVRIIDQHLSDPDFFADDLARKMQLHKQHLVKKLNALTGKEPTQLIREMRLEKAKALLEKRAGNPQTIAELVGFSSSGTFALAFKEYFGENTLLLHNDSRRY